MSNTPKFWPGPDKLLEWIGEVNLSRDENLVVIAVSAEAVLNAYTQWYESHREASVEMAVWKRCCDHLLVISEQATKLRAETLSQNLIVQKIKLHEPKRFDGSQDMEVVTQYLEDVQHFVRQGGAVCQGASKDNQKIDTFWRFLTGKVFHWFENSMKKQGVDAIPPEEYNYNITWDDMKVLFKRQYVPEQAISVIRREWYALKFSHQLVLSFNQRALELITILGRSLTITRENPLWEEYLIKLPEATQNDISQQAHLMDILGNGSQMTLSSMMDIVTARMLPFQPMPSGSAILVLNPTKNNEVNTIVDGKIQSRFKPREGHHGGRDGPQKYQLTQHPPPTQQSQYCASQPNWQIPVKYLDNVDNPEAKSGAYIKGGWPDKREVTEHPPTREREGARLYLTNLNVIRKDIIDKSDLLRFYAKVQTSHSKTHAAYTLMDPGASHCYIDTAFAKQLGLPFRHAGRMSIITAGTKHPPEDRYQVWLNGRIGGITGNYVDVTSWYTVFDLKGAYDIIIGKNWHSKTHHLVDSDSVLHLLDADWSLLTDGRPAFVPKLTLKGLRPHQGRYREVHNHCAAVAKAASINLISADETRRAMSRLSGDRIFVIDIRERRMGDEFGEDDSVLADLGKWRVQIRHDFDDLFQPPSGVPPPGGHDFCIHTDPTAKIPHSQPYRMTQSERNEFEVQIKKLLEKGWVTDSHSRYAAPIIVVKKQDATLRMCVDYRGLNSITAKDRYPLPYIEDLLDKLHRACVFTKLDLASGYHQVGVHPDNCHKTAFIVPDGFYKYKVIPFGLANAPAAFMRMMHKILHPHHQNSIVYLDDVLIFSKTLAEHKTHVEGVLQELRNARLRLSETKCVFGTRETSFVGFRVNRHGIHTEEKKVKAVRDWPTPKMPTELRGFLGLAGYYRKFVPKFAHQAHLLHDLASKPKSEYVWTSQHADQFKDLKEALISSLVLATLDPDADFILRTDASDTAIGGILAQKQMFEGRLVERPLGYFLRKLHAVEARYPAYDRELPAISANLEHWACYDHGRKCTTIYTDHASLQYILGQNKLMSRQWRHLDRLQQHDYEVKYFPGVANVVTDALSRIAYT